MPLADIKARVLEITSTYRRLLTVIGALFLTYSLIGFFALPGIIQKQAQQFVQDQLKLELNIKHIEFNPWRLAVRLDELSITDPSDKTILVSVHSIFVNVELWSSLWIRGASLGELDLLKPYVNARIYKDGNINLMKLVPPDDGEPPSDPHWRIGLLGIHQGRVSFEDQSRITPFSTVFSPLNLSLSDLSSNANRDGGYTLHAETGDGEALDWKGIVAMNPLRSEGELRITGLKATTPWRYLQDELPVVIEKGLIGISGHYQLTAGDDVNFTLKDGHITVKNLSLYQRSKNPLALTLENFTMSGMEFVWPSQAASFKKMQFTDIHFTDKNSLQTALQMGGLQLDNGRYQATEEFLALDSVQLTAFSLADVNEQPALVTLPALMLRTLKASVPEKQLTIGHIGLEKGVINAQRFKNGQINWESRLNALMAQMAGFTPGPSSGSSTTTPPDEKSWQVTLGDLGLSGFRVNFIDNVPAEKMNVSLENIDLLLHPRHENETNHQLGGKFDVASGGSATFKGTFLEQPVTAHVDLQLAGLKLPPFAPLAADVANFSLEKGSLSVDGRFNFKQQKTTQADFSGNVTLNDFAANDLELDERFLAWQKLAINGIQWQMQPEKLTIRSIEATKPFMRVIIDENRNLNLTHILIANESDESAVAAPSSQKSNESIYPVKVDRIHMKDGAMLFADLSLRPQFATGIQSLQGDIRGLSSQPGSNAIVDLKGRVDEYGKADISGTVNPLAGDLNTDISLKFSNVELTTLTPYSSKFAGYRIDKGKLSLDLNYKINQRKLNATNKIVLNQLTLGEKVPSPDAMSIPLRLALAILKDKDGVIDLDVPVNGSLDDPKFKVGPIIWKAFVNLLTKAATAPFSLIAGLVGGGENMDSISFAAGASTLNGEETKKIDAIARALTQRTALAVELRGAFDPETDRTAIRTRKFEDTYQRLIADGKTPRKALEELYKVKLGSEALAQQRALNLKPSVDKADNRTDLKLATDAYETSLRNELVARETVLDGDLRQLALDRARLIRNQLIEGNSIAEDRIFVLEPVNTKASGENVITKVTLTAQ